MRRFGVGGKPEIFAMRYTPDPHPGDPLMNASPTRKSTASALILGLMALTGGLWLFLNAQGFGVPRFRDYWPALLLVAAAGALVDYLFLSKKPSLAGWTVVWTGLGVLGLALTLDYTELADILDWLPSFPMILGLAFLATWLASGRRNEHLAIAAGILVVLGLVGFAARFDWLKRILPSAQVVWALLLLAGGGYLVWRAIQRARD